MRLLCNQVRIHRPHGSLALHEWPLNQALKLTAAQASDCSTVLALPSRLLALRAAAA